MNPPDLKTKVKNAAAIDGFVVVCLIWAPMITPGLNDSLTSEQESAIMILGPLYLFFGDSICGRSFGKFFQGIAVFEQKTRRRAGFLRCLTRNLIPWIAPTTTIAAVYLFDEQLRDLGKPIASAMAVFLIGLVIAGYSLRNRYTSTEVSLTASTQEMPNANHKDS